MASMPSLSPDGSRFAHELWRPGMDRSELWVMDIEKGTRELLATNGSFPIWSRDGTKVVYTYRRQSGPRLEAAVAYRQLGGTERFLTPWSSSFYFFPFDWTPDGGSVLGPFLLAGPGMPPTSVGLWPTSKPKAQQPERILLSSPAGAQVWCTTFSPDSRWILFTVVREDRNMGWSLELAVARPGTPPEQWVRSPGTTMARQAAVGSRRENGLLHLERIDIASQPMGSSIRSRIWASRLARRSRSLTSIHRRWRSLHISTARIWAFLLDTRCCRSRASPAASGCSRTSIADRRRLARRSQEEEKIEVGARIVFIDRLSR